MRIHQWAAGLGLLTLLAAPAAAQDTTPEPKKPGGLNKVARNVSGASKTAGRQIKSNLKSASSDAHQVLKKAGNDSKAEAKRVTGHTAPANDHPGGVNKVARDISHASKVTSAKAKNAVKKSAAKTHGALTDAGKATKDTLKKIKPPV